jgi:hypothetical protein
MTDLNVAFAALALLLFLFMPARTTPLSRFSPFAAVFLLLLALFAVPPAVDGFRELASPLRGILGNGREVVVASLDIEDRRMLNRLVGGRHRVRLSIEGFLYAPRDGTYELELGCDDRCSLDLGGRRVLTSEGLDKTSVELTEGVHKLRIEYAQFGGPAHLRVDWRRPGLINLLPLSQFVAGRADVLTASGLTYRRLKLVGVLAGALLVYSGLLFHWAAIGPALRRSAFNRLRTWWEASIHTEKKPQSLSRRELLGFSALFLVGFAARSVVLFGEDIPILYGHPYGYYNNALRILEHPDPWSFIWRSDEWHLWQSWTVAPLYYLLLAALFHLIGPGLTPFRVAHALLSAAGAVSVALLGKRLAGPKGLWVGVVYAFFWPAIELLNSTLTENLHTPLFLIATVFLLRESDAPGRGRAFGAGVVLGLSAMTRAVSSAFFAVVIIWRLFLKGVSIDEARRNWVFSMAIGLGGALVILPWTARNVFVIGDPVLIETVSFFNLVYDNEPRPEMRAEVFQRGPGPTRRDLAVRVATRGIRENPEHFLRKVSTNFWHFLRLEGLHYWLSADFLDPGWRHGAHVLFGDVPIFLAIVLFFPWLLAGRASPTRRLILYWIGYYMLLVVVVFHNETRYRDVFLPFLIAAAAGGISALRTEPRRFGTYVGLLIGLVVASILVAPYPVPALHRLRSSAALRPVEGLIERGSLEEAIRAVSRAAELDRGSPRPYWRFGHWLAKYRLAEIAIDAYRRGEAVAPMRWPSHVVMPQLLREAGRGAELTDAIRTANRDSWYADPWIMLEIAWRELPPPVTDVVQLGWGDYGAVRGFTLPQGDVTTKPRDARSMWKRSEPGFTPPGHHRFTRDKAWVRLIPTYLASEHRLVIEMGSPYPSILHAPEVRVAVKGGREESFVLDRTVRPYEIDVQTEPGDVIEVRLEAPLWSRAGERGPQGVRVDRVLVRPR